MLNQPYMIRVLQYSSVQHNEHCFIFLLMEKSKVQNYELDKALLNKYINALFPDIIMPEIQLAAEDKIKGKVIKLQPNIALTTQQQTLLESQAIMYLHSGVVELHKKMGRRWQRQIELKEGFFSLVNFRAIDGVQPEWFKMTLKTKCSLSVLPLKQSHRYAWLRDKIIKNHTLARIFYYNDTGFDIQRKKDRFKEFIKNFKHEVIRRDTRFIVEGQKNNKVYIISKGEAKLYKNMSIKGSKGEVSKNTQIVFIREGSVIGAEVFLISSKIIHTIMSHHSNIVEEQQNDQEDEEEEEDSPKKKKKAKSKLKRVHVDSGGYELYAPHQNISNYSVIAQSANLQVYSIPIDRLVSTIFERQKGNFVKMVEQTYVTILRRTHQKMGEIHHKQQQKVNNSNHKMNIVASKIYTSNHQSDMDSSSKDDIIIRRSEVGNATDNLNKLRRQEVQQNQNKNLQKRAELIIHQVRPKTDFKLKIEALLEEKLKSAANYKNEEKQFQIVHDLGQIFRKNNEGRTEDVYMQNEVLDKKTHLLAKRGGWKQGWDMLRQEGAPIPPNRSKSVIKNYLKHTSREQLAFRVKEQCVGKIHQANKIKQQFMKIKSECPSCTCYDNFQKFSTQKRRTMSNFTRTAYRTTQGWGRKTRAQSSREDQPLEEVYNQMRFLSEKAKEKYNHNIHLLKCRRNKDKLERRKSAPMI